MSSVWDMILQWGSTIKVSIELPVATRHRRDMTEKLLKATLNPNSHTHTDTHTHTFQSLSTNTITIQLALRSSCGGVSKAFSKSKISVSACPPLSKILAQSFITVINWVSQLCLFRNACCLSDKSLCSSKCAMILEHTMCSSNLHGTQVRETGR